MTILLILLLGISPLFYVSEINATEIYRWRDAEGRVHFGDHPEQGARDAVQVPLNPLLPEPSQRQGHEETQRKIQQVVEQQQRERKQAEKIEQAKRKQSQRQQSRAMERCESVRKRLSDIREQWRYKRRKGYRAPDKERFKLTEERLVKQLEAACER